MHQKNHSMAKKAEGSEEAEFGKIGGEPFIPSKEAHSKTQLAVARYVRRPVLGIKEEPRRSPSLAERSEVAKEQEDESKKFSNLELERLKLHQLPRFKGRKAPDTIALRR